MPRKIGKTEKKFANRTSICSYVLPSVHTCRCNIRETPMQGMLTGKNNAANRETLNDGLLPLREAPHEMYLKVSTGCLLRVTN